MRSRLTAALAAFAMLGLAPSLAMAEDVQEQLRKMQERLQQMEDRLQATDDQLEAANRRVEDQAALIESAGIVEGASSGLGCFVCDLTIGGWVAGSYTYNINDPNDAKNGPLVDTDGDGIPDTRLSEGLFGTNQGEGSFFYPFHPDHNSFAVDQVWFEVEKEITEENRAGFRFDVLYGRTARQLGGPLGFNNDDSDLNVYQAYVQYAPPIGDESTVIKFGKFATPIGFEKVPTVYNYNITRGNVFNLLQPINHIGIIAGGDIGETGLNWTLGGVNGFNPDAADRNDRKSVLGGLGWANDVFSLNTAVLWGGETIGFDGDEAGLVDVILTWTPSDRFSMYLNGDFGWMDEPQGTDLDPYGWGIALGGRFGITERTGFSLRGEYVRDEDGFILANGKFGGLQNMSNPAEFRHVWGVTGTIDHLLTDHLMIRAEARWDYVDIRRGRDDIFFEDDTADEFGLVGDEDNQIVLAVEVIYNFNKFGGE